MKPRGTANREDSLTSRIALACCYEHASSEPSLQPQLPVTETGGNDQRRRVSVCSPRQCLRQPFSAKTIHPDLPRGLRASFCVCHLGSHIRGLREYEPSLRSGGLPHCCAHRRGTRFPIALSRRQYRTERVGRARLSLSGGLGFSPVWQLFSRVRAHPSWFAVHDGRRNGRGHLGTGRPEPGKTCWILGGVHLDVKPHFLPLANFADLGFCRQCASFDRGLPHDARRGEKGTRGNWLWLSRRSGASSRSPILHC